MIPYGKQDISQADIDSVVAVLKSDYLTQGPQVPLFEQSVASAVQAEFAVALNSATSALHVACLALGLGKGDRLWTSPNTFVASSNCALYCGAKVDFVDIDKHSYNMCVLELEKKLKLAKEQGSLPKIIIPVHFAGQSCDMKRIYELSQEYGFKIIEDASHAIGGKYLGRPVGNCQYSDITVFSFHPVKIVTTAEGGVAVTNQKKLAQKMQLFRSHGVTRDVDLMTKELEGPWYYQQVDLGFNYRMTEIQAALGLSQITRLDSFVEIRNRLANIYNEALDDLPLKLPFVDSNIYSSYHLYPIQILSPSKTRLQVFNALREKGIGVNVHYIPVHTQPYYHNLGFKEGDFKEAEKYYANAISIPLHQDLKPEEQTYVINVLKELLE